MNKYALGTVLGTALLGVAKSKLGSGSLKFKIGYKHAFEGVIEFIIEEESFLPLQGNQYILDKIESTIKSYGATFEGFNFEEVEQVIGGGEIYVDHFFNIDIKKSYLTENEETTFDDFGYQFDTLLGKLENAISSILGNCLEDVNADISGIYRSTHPYIQNQSGEWVPYKHPNKDSKLRKR